MPRNEDLVRLKAKEDREAANKTPQRPQGGGAPLTGSRWQDYEAEQRAQGFDFVPWQGKVPEDVNRPLGQMGRRNAWDRDEQGKYQGLQEQTFNQLEDQFSTQELPEGAVGWTEHGEPFFGGTTPYQEWQLKSNANMQLGESTTADEASWSDWDAPNIAQQYREGGFKAGAKALLGGIAEGVEQINESVDFWLAGKPQGDQTETTAMQNFWRSASYNVKSPFMAVFEGVPYQAELGLGGVLNVSRAALGMNPGQENYWQDQRLDAALLDVGFAQPHDNVFWRETDWKAEYLEGAAAGRILYTTWWEDVKSGFTGGEYRPGSVKAQEYLRELRDNPNENPYLLASQYENIWAESIGRAVLDPLNIFEFGAKAAFKTIGIARAAKFFDRALPAVAQAMKAKKASRIGGLVDEAQDLTQLSIIATARGADVAQVAAKNAKLAQSKTIIQLTNGAKGHILGQETGTITNWIVRQARNPATGKFDPDIAFRMMESVGKTAAGKFDEAGEFISDAARMEEGLVELNRFPGWDVVLTEPGTRAALQMQDLTTNKALRTAMRKAETQLDLLNIADAAVAKHAKDMFPTLANQIKLDPNGLNFGWKALSKTHEYMYTKGPYKWFNNFFSGMYLGLSPGYVARNYMQNTVQSFLDEGIRGVVGIRSGDEIAAWSGDAARGADSLGLPGMTDGFGAAGGETNASFVSRLPGLKYGGKVESFSSQKLFGKIYPETMKKVLKSADVKGNLIKHFDISESTAEMVSRKLIANKGDVDKTFNDLIEAAKKGYISVLETDARLTPAQSAFLDEHGMWDQFYEINKTSETVEDAQKAWKGLTDEMLTFADGVVDDIPDGIVGSEAENIITDYTYANMRKSLTNEELAAQVTYHTANKQSVLDMGDLVETYKAGIIDEVGREIGQVNAQNMAKSTMANTKLETIMGTVTGDQLTGQQMSDLYRVMSDEIGQPLKVLINEIELGVSPERLEEIWLKTGLDKFYGRAITKADNRKEVINHLWRKYERDVRPVWESWRDDYAALSKLTTDALQEEGEQVLGRALKPADYGLAGKTLEKAQKFDKFLNKNEIFAAMASAKRTNRVSDAAFAWAKQYKLDFFDKSGRFVDKRLVNVINKQLGRKFTSITEMNGRVSFDQMHEAISSYALGETTRLVANAGDEGFDLLRQIMTKAEDLTPDNEAQIERLLSVLDEVDPGLRKNIDDAFAERHVIPQPQSAADTKGYNEIIKARDAADETIEGAIQQAQDALTGIEEGMANNISKKVVAASKAKPKLTPDMTTWSGMNAPSDARKLYDQRDNIITMQEQFNELIGRNFGRLQKVEIDATELKNLQRAKKWTAGRVEAARRVSAKTALEKRNFILHDYGKKRNFDLMLSYMMPYHFWYSRTYTAWLQRTVTHPGTIAAYMQYKDAMGKMHADLPDWLKYSINSNELLGLDSSSPFYIELEKAMMPLNGVTGVDFEDPDKRTNWFNTMVDDMGKYGPSMYTPLAWAIGYDLYKQGEEESAAKWVGRTVPQTAPVKAATHLLNQTFGIGGEAWKGGLELDPGVRLFSGGVDVWERGQIGRALGWAVDNGELTPAQAQQAAVEGKSNEDFRNAQATAYNNRAPGQLTSFFLGTGFRQRPAEDLEIDQMDKEFANFMGQRDNMDPDEIKDAYAYFNQKYSFFSTVKLARRDPDERDAAYAYSVLPRIPPGQTKAIYEAMGVEGNDVNYFYEHKGDLSGMPEADRETFMRGVVELGAITDVPDGASQAEWREVRRRYTDLQETLLAFHGQETVNKKDYYWALFGEDRDKANDFLDDNPEVQAFLDDEVKGKGYDPLMSKYYNTWDRMRGYYTGDAWDTIYEKADPNIKGTLDEYYDIFDSKERKAFRTAHPEIQEYWDLKDVYLPMALQKVESFARHLPESKPEPAIRPEEQLPEQLSNIQEDIIEGIGGPVTPEYFRWTWPQWAETMSPNLSPLVLDWAEGEDLPSAAVKSLDRIFEDMDVDKDMAMRLIRDAIATGQ